VQERFYSYKPAIQKYPGGIYHKCGRPKLFFGFKGIGKSFTVLKCTIKDPLDLTSEKNTGNQG
jgi:hypothetical protein